MVGVGAPQIGQAGGQQLQPDRRGELRGNGCGDASRLRGVHRRSLIGGSGDDARRERVVVGRRLQA